MAYSREKRVAIEAVSHAAELCQSVQSEIVQNGPLEKADRSPVTIADFGSQALICHCLKTSFPQDSIVGEEDSTELRKPENASWLARVVRYVQRLQATATSEAVCRWIDAGGGAPAQRFWTLDPIDGTKGFLRDDQYAIALALVEDGQVKVGVLGCPALALTMDNPDGETGVLFVAVKGEGAAMLPLGGASLVPIHVAHGTDPAEWRFVQSFEATHGDFALQEAAAHAIGITRPPLRMDSQVKYGAVARGDAVLYLRFPSPESPDYREKIWDHAAGSLIVEEAGGRVTDMHGRPLDFVSGRQMHDNQGVIASSGSLHAAALGALARCRSAED
jgi:3'(2'), 5'-bisphosphate nucleotidase